MKQVDCYDIINSVVRTEKGTMMLGENKYLFRVNMSANKVQIKEAVEKIYSVEVEKVNTVKIHGKKRRIRFKQGKRADWKKAIVTLKEGYSIEVT